MSDEIKKLQPEALWNNFYSLTQIPRPSKNELKAARFVCDFGKKLGFQSMVDAVGNVIISKPATPGCEKKKGVILQAHIDMVPQKNNNVSFDFDTDAIDAYVDGEWVTARDTTLGADNGIGVAAALAVLQSDTIKHGPLEILITIDEETGMTGAVGLEKGLLKGDILINLDTENDEEISIGCAGGINVSASWDFVEEKNDFQGTTFRLMVSGLKGGHSGLDIHLGRGNACKIMARLLKTAVSKFGARLASIDCGNMRNAIPREGVSVIVIPKEKVNGFLSFIDNTSKLILNELGSVEPNLKIVASEVGLPETLIPEMIQDDVINAVCAARNGIMRLSDTMPGVVETSNNISIVRSSAGKIEILCLTRSFIDSARDAIASSLDSCFRLAGAAVNISGAYPGWRPNTASQILALAKEQYKNLRGVYPRQVAMHAGLECGILAEAYPNWDIISVGPTIQSPHSPDERVNIQSVTGFWDFLVSILENVPEK
ncbi:MAG: aminoacyl-histidine dipeptidase [Bacteroidales bacterium]|nr:aminoacyl-histidine dipeptidase [Bacteroidales bacterium]